MIKFEWKLKKSQFGQAPPPISLERSYSWHSTEEPGCSLPSSPKASRVCWSSSTSAMISSQCATPDAWHEEVLEESRLQCPAWPARTSRKNCNWSCYESYSSANNVQTQRRWEWCWSELQSATERMGFRNCFKGWRRNNRKYFFKTEKHQTNREARTRLVTQLILASSWVKFGHEKHKRYLVISLMHFFFNFEHQEAENNCKKTQTHRTSELTNLKMSRSSFAHSCVDFIHIVGAKWVDTTFQTATILISSSCM